MKKPIKTCKHCEKEYKSDNVTFCSKECQQESIKENNKKNCTICDKIFYTNRSTKVKTCSKECSIKSRVNTVSGKIKEHLWEVRSCPICTTEFKVRKKYEKICCTEPCRLEYCKIHKEEIDSRGLISRKKTLLERYGVESVMHIQGMSERLSQIQKSKTPEQIQQMVSKGRKTKFEKYGDENYRDINKRKSTCLERYGDENYNNRPKFMETIIERYGDYHLRLPEFKEKQRNTFMERYGANGALGIEGAWDKAYDAHLKKYNNKNYVQSDIFLSSLNKSQSEIVKQRLEKFEDFIWLNENEFETFVKTRFLKLQCKKCNNILHSTRIQADQKPICRKCFPSSKYSSINLFAQNYIKSIYDGEMLTNDRSLIRPYEIDIFLSEYKIGFEMNGNYFHSTGFGGKETDYHIMKTKLAHDKGIKMIHIFEDEVEYNYRVLKSFIDRTLGKSKLIQYPQDLDININIDEDVRIDFMKRNSLYNYIKCDFDVILYKDDVIYYMVSIRVKDNNFTIVNETTLLDYNIVDGLNFIIKHLLEKHNVNKLKYISNIRLNGLGHLKEGFKSISITNPNKYHINKIDYYHRARRIGDALLKMTYENMVFYLKEENEMDYIYDCGSEVFELVR